MGKNISGCEYSIAKIFLNFCYVIPPYQRPYAWTIEETAELFDDLLRFYQNEKEGNYFLGSIVLIKQDDAPDAEVIDGQQRLTTLTILLSVIASRLSNKARIDYEGYLKAPGSDSQDLPASPRLTLRQKEQKFFEEYIQEIRLEKLIDLDPSSFETEAKKNIRGNCEYLLDRINQEFPTEESVKGFGKFLVQRCFLVAVCTPTQQSAFHIFSVMNNRGIQLSPTDIIKADALGRIIHPNEQDDYAEKWENIEEDTGRDGFVELFGHIRMIYAKTKAKKALLEDFKEFVVPLSTPKQFIDDVVEPYAEAYCDLYKKNYKSAKNAQEVNGLLAWLNKINNADWFPPAILFLAENRNSPDYILWFFRKLERLAAYMHIAAEDVNYRIKRYAEIIREIQENPKSSLETPLKTIELSATEKNNFIKVLDGNVYDDLTALRRNYMILRLDSFVADGAASYDPSVLTIEHVLPQTVNPDSEWAQWWPVKEKRLEWVDRIANLVPLTRRKNSVAQNHDFSEKKKAYFRGKSGTSSYALTTQVLNTETWTEDVVSNRQKELIEKFKSAWML